MMRQFQARQRESAAAMLARMDNNSESVQCLNKNAGLEQVAVFRHRVTPAEQPVQTSC